jgi:hypothetical protein
MTAGHADYQLAMGLLDRNARLLKDGADKDAIGWNLNTALSLLVRGFQTDMQQLQSRLDAIDKKLSIPK